MSRGKNILITFGVVYVKLKILENYYEATSSVTHKKPPSVKILFPLVLSILSKTISLGVLQAQYSLKGKIY